MLNYYNSVPTWIIWDFEQWKQVIQYCDIVIGLIDDLSDWYYDWDLRMSETHKKEKMVEIKC